MVLEKLRWFWDTQHGCCRNAPLWSWQHWACNRLEAHWNWGESRDKVWGFSGPEMFQTSSNKTPIWHKQTASQHFVIQQLVLDSSISFQDSPSPVKTSAADDHGDGDVPLSQPRPSSPAPVAAVDEPAKGTTESEPCIATPVRSGMRQSDDLLGLKARRPKK